MSDLPAFVYSDRGLAKDQAFEAWRQVMAPVFTIRPPRSGAGLPRGGLSVSHLGDITAGRCLFNAQHLTRQKTLIDATPDHVILRLYLSGGFFGEFGGRPVQISRGQVTICDLRLPLDVDAMTSDTIGLTIPRPLLADIDLERLPHRLGPARERLLAARMAALHHRLPRLAATDASAVTADLLATLHRLFDPSTATDVLEGQEFDADLFTLADRLIAVDMASPHLSPATIADGMRVSRATLYRVFAPAGGVMQHVWDMRFEAVKTALDQGAETRTLSRLAADHGFKSSAHLSRGFRARYGVSPRDWRERYAREARAMRRDDPRLVQGWWRDLGR